MWILILIAECISSAAGAVVQLPSCVRLFVTPWTAAHQASLSFTTSWSLLKLMSSRCCHPNVSSTSPPAFSLSQHQGLFQWISSSPQVAKILELQLHHQSFQWIFGLISSRIDWFDSLAVQGILRSLLQHHGSKPNFFFFLNEAGSNSKGCIGLWNWKAKRHDANIRQILIQLSTFTKESWFLFFCFSFLDVSFILRISPWDPQMAFSGS